MYLFIDTETTGLPRGGIQPRIVSIAWVVDDSPEKHRSLRYMLVRPDGFDIPVDATRIHGITTAVARRTGVPLDVALQSLKLDVSTHRPTTVVAHNLDFDRPIIDAEYARARRPSPLRALKGTCTVRLAQAA